MKAMHLWMSQKVHQTRIDDGVKASQTRRARDFLNFHNLIGANVFKSNL